MKHLLLGVLLLATNVAHADGLKLSDKVVVNGIFQGRYGAMQGPKDNWKSGSVDIRRAEIGLLFTPTSKLSAKFQADFSKGTTTTKDLWVKYLVLPNLGATLGQFVVPFGMENQVSDADLITLERATFASVLFPSRRDRGIKAELTKGDNKLVLALVNGDGPNVSAAGNHKEGIVRLSLPVCPFAKIGASGLFGNDAFGSKNAFGVDVQTQVWILTLGGEYVRAHEAGVNPNGWLVQAVMPITMRDNLVAKYDTFAADLKPVVVHTTDTSTSSRVDDVKTLNLGIIHTINNNLSLKLFFVNSQVRHLGNSNGVTAEVLVHF